MVERVFLHIGQPKTGTTYLQRILWLHRDALLRQGILMPGTGHREHLWAALDAQGAGGLERRHQRAPGSWERLCGELDGSDVRTGLITHEFFCGASAERAAAVVARLAPAEVHLIVTTRDPASMLAAGWQEYVKNGGRSGIHRIADPARDSEFSWQTWDPYGVLNRWGETVPPSRLHVLPVPDRGAPPDQLWRNFASVVGIAGDFELPEDAVNASLGAVQVQLLRKVNAHLRDVSTAQSRGVWIRGYLAEQTLARQGGDRFGLDEELVADCRERSERAIALIQERGFDVVGDLGGLRVPETMTERRSLGSVTQAEMVDAAARMVADMLQDVRRLQAEAEAGRRGGPGGLRRRARRLLRGA